MQIRFNLSVLEQWCREHQIPNCNEVIDQLNPITQATKLLQTKKTEDNISTIVEMCNKLTSSQIMKILNLYTAVDEENISADFLKKIQAYLREQRKDGKWFFRILGYSRDKSSVSELLKPAMFTEPPSNRLLLLHPPDANKSTLLFDTKHTFPLTIPYKPLDVKLQNINLPPFLLKQGLGTVLKKL